MKEAVVLITILIVVLAGTGCSVHESVLDALCHQIPFQEGDYVTLRKNIEVVKTYHCSRCSEQEAFPCEFRYDLWEGEIALIESHEDLGFWLDQTALFPRCSYCRIHHATKGAAWVDCLLLVRVEMQED